MSSHIHPTVPVTSSLNAIPTRRITTRHDERLMSFSWFVGLHIPILYTLLTGNTTLAWSIWPESYFNIDRSDDPKSNNIPSPPDFHPIPHSIWYPIAFFTLLTVTFVMYFVAALSYPGYIDDEYKSHKSSSSDDISPSQRGRNGYTRVTGVEDTVTPNQGREVHIDMTTITRRIVVEEASPHQSHHNLSHGAPPSSFGSSSESIPISVVGEASEAADLAAVGCTPPVALPMLESLGLSSRQQIHANDQTETSNDQIREQSNDIPINEHEMTSLTREHRNDIHSINHNQHDRTLPSHSSDTVMAIRLPSSSSAAPSLSSSTSPSSSTTGYCSMCQLIRPARAKHCYKCRHCVSKFDHHCPFVANCIGAQNHRYFLTYLWCQVLTMLWGMTLNTEPFLYHYSTKAFYGHACISVIMIGQLLASSMLCMFHSWLALTNQTTYQIIKMQDASLARTPQAIQARREERRRRARRMGDETSDSDDDLSNNNGPELTWSTYHVGFFCNIWTFCLGRVPIEHRLPRSILDEDGTWKHLPHAIEEVQIVHSRITNGVSGDEETIPGTILRPIEVRSMASTVRDAATSFTLQYHGRPLPTTDAELSAFPDPDHTEPSEAYTRPTRILGHARSKGVNGRNGNSFTKREPDTDDEHVESVEL